MYIEQWQHVHWGWWGSAPPKILRKSFPFQNTTRDSIFTFLSLALDLTCAFCMNDGRLSSFGISLWQGVPRIIENLANHFSLVSIH